MSDKMQVLFVKQTGHVLAAFTRTADPEGKVSANDLTGSGVRIRNVTRVGATPPGGETLSVPPDSLDVAVVNFDADVFTSPLSFAAGGGVVAQLGTDIPQTIPSADFKTGQITVTLSSPAAEDLSVWLQLEEVNPLPGNEPERRVTQGLMSKTESTVDLNLTIRPGGPPASIPKKDFYVLVLVAGHQPLFAKMTPT